MKKLLYVTGSRAEYGIMRRLLKKLDTDKEISLDIVVTGMHLAKEYGETYKEIEKDFKIAKKIDIEISNKNNYEVLHSMSIAMEEFSKYFKDNEYDALILLGDRYEILPVAIAAAFNNIPIIHLHGGEKTLGNYDEFIRHSITKMSKLHLVATEEYRKRVIQLGENPTTVFNLGSLGVNNVLEVKLLSKEELDNKLGKIDKPYYVVLFHPETISEISLEEQTNNLIKALSKFKDKYSFVFIGSNSDTGADKIQEIIEKFVKENNYKRFISLQNVEYFSLLKYSEGLIGNSSSGIIEIPSLKVATINIGNRQLGRAKGETIIDCGSTEKEIENAILKSQSNKYREILKNSINPYFQENSLEKYYQEIKKFLEKAEKGMEVQDYEFILKEITIQETSPYESRLNLLASVISISPMLGLLGTVTGMIRAFTNISKYGAGDAAIVADGIAEALLTTAAGLMIAIPVIVVYNYLNRRLEKMENEIDDVVTNIINIFRR